MNAADILARLHVLFGIPPGDATHDAELMALFETALAAARTYTQRWLYPVASFKETFEQPVSCGRCRNDCPAVVSEVPALEVTSANRDGTALEPATVIVGPAGAVYQRSGGRLVALPPFSTFELVYRAGYEPLPADLAEALCQIAAAAGGVSVAAAGGSAGEPAVVKRTVFDVGSVEFAESGAFFSGDVKLGTGTNALLGPWASVLDPYRDLAKSLGGDDCIHIVERLPDATTAATAAQP
jgi:hypothetical protein